MKTTEQIKNEIDALNIKLGELNIELSAAKERENNEPWTPKDEERYWIIDSDGTTPSSLFTGSFGDKCMIAIGNCFRTKGEADAEEERRIVTKLLRDAATRAGRKNGAFIKGASNIAITFEENEMKSMVCITADMACHQGVIYFPSVDDIEVAVSKIGADRIHKAFFEDINYD